MSSDLKNTSRRKFTKGTTLAVVGVAAVVGGGITVTRKPKDNRPIVDRADLPEAIELKDYKPDFFNESEWAFILAACDRLIPADDIGPGALETNVPIFIDLQMQGEFGQAKTWYMKEPFVDTSPLMGYQSPLTPAETYQKGIAATEAHCQTTFSKGFAELSDDEKDALLTQLQKGEIEFEGVSSAQFFAFLLQNTKEGFFADPIHGGNKDMAAWKMIGFPGARASYLEWADIHNTKYPLGPVSITGKRG